MTLFNRNGSSYYLHNEEDLNIQHALPAGVYILSFNPQIGYFLTVDDRFKLPKKLYGDADKRADRVINTFKHRGGSTGIILAGEKGSGKTLLSKVISEKLIADGMPTIIVNQAYCGDGFNKFMTAIEQPAFVIFDEYEKVYSNPDSQNALLTLFDGLFTSQKLFAITTNDSHKINDFMRNRPGRFFYSFTYKGVDELFIREYLRDNLNNKEHIDSFVRFASVFDAFNFDMLQALVEEMNRYDESVIEAAAYVNVAPTYVSRNKYKIVTAVIPKLENFYEYVNYGDGINPLVHRIRVYDEEGENCVDFEVSDIVAMRDGKTHYKNEYGEVIIEREEPKTFDWRSAI